MPKNVTIKAFEFNELVCGHAKDKVRAWVNDGVVDHITESILEDLAYSGIKVYEKTLSWSIDRDWYLSFDGFPIFEHEVMCRAICCALEDREARMILAWIKHDLFGYDIQIKNMRYGVNTYAAKTDIIFDYIDHFPERVNEDTPLDIITKKLDDFISRYFENIIERTLRAARDDYEYCYTDEAVADMCEANGYVFDELGNPIHHLIQG